MSGIYIHIPFCSKACHYCDFHFSTALKMKEELIDSMVKEIHLRKNDFQKKFNSLYFGGGTPSLLTEKELEKILNALSNYVSVESMSEITIEINPEDVEIQKLKTYKKLGINRLSIGVQSLDDKFLKWMNRGHTKSQIVKSINLINEMNFDNYSLDFIYGLPTNLKRNYKKEMEELIKFNPNHISCYHLTIESGTYFGSLKAKNKWKGIKDQKSEEEFLWISERLKANNYHHYEVSNFSKVNQKAYHNSNYWEQKPYVGIGPSAHSFDNKTRRWNIANNKKYILQINSKSAYSNSEKLSNIDLFNEKIMLGLRTEKGFNLEELMQKIDQKEKKIFKDKLQTFFNDGLLVRSKNRIKIPANKWLLSDYVTREFFILKE